MDEYNFILTRDQAEAICEKFEKDINALEEYEVLELLDKVIDEFLCR